MVKTRSKARSDSDQNTTPQNCGRTIKTDKRMPDVKVRLQRLSKETLSNLTESTYVDYNLSASIHGNTLSIDQHCIKSNDGNFSIKLKLSNDRISVFPMESSVDHPASSQRNLRSKSTIVNTNKLNKLNNNMCRAVVKVTPKIEPVWEQCKKENRANSSNIFKTNDIVAAKLKGHMPWPSKIIEICDKKKAKVEFFGAMPHERFGFVPLSEIVLFSNALKLVRIIARKNNAKYNKGIKEVEILLGVSACTSILHD